ncbi:MAG: hypothetical protein ACLTSG_03555 [Lachnospiraceae bacterium]
MVRTGGAGLVAAGTNLQALHRRRGAQGGLPDAELALVVIEHARALPPRTRGSAAAEARRT